MFAKIMSRTDRVNLDWVRDRVEAKKGKSADSIQKLHKSAIIDHYVRKIPLDRVTLETLSESSSMQVKYLAATLFANSPLENHPSLDQEKLAAFKEFTTVVESLEF